MAVTRSCTYATTACLLRETSICRHTYGLSNQTSKAASTRTASGGPTSKPKSQRHIGWRVSGPLSSIRPTRWAHLAGAHATDRPSVDRDARGRGGPMISLPLAPSVDQIWRVGTIRESIARAGTTPGAAPRVGSSLSKSRSASPARSPSRSELAAQIDEPEKRITTRKDFLTLWTSTKLIQSDANATSVTAH